MGDHAEMTPHYLIIDGLQFECNTPDLPCRDQCTHNGLYCAEDPEHDFESGLDGNDIVLENLRQLCIWEVTKGLGSEHKWWDYVSLFDEKCEHNSDFGAPCSEQQQGASGMTASEIAKVRDCVTKSDVCTVPSATSLAACTAAGGVWKNTKLEAELEARRKDGMYILPTIMINDQKYRGRLTCPHPIWMQSCGVLQAICSAFADPNVTDACTEDYCWEVKDDCGTCRSSRTDPHWNRDCCKGEDGAFNQGLSLDACGVCGGTGSFDTCDPPNCRQADDPHFGDCSPEFSQRGGGAKGSDSNDIAGLVVGFLFVLVFMGFGTMWYIKRKERRMRSYVENIVANYMPLQDGGAGVQPNTRGGGARMMPFSDKDSARMLGNTGGMTIDLGGGSPNQEGSIAI